MSKFKVLLTIPLLLASMMLAACEVAHAGTQINGHVLSGSMPIARSRVTLWAATAGAPSRISEVISSGDGTFSLALDATDRPAASYYIVATGGTTSSGKAENAAIKLISVLGASPPPSVTVNEMTTIAAVWTHNQLLHGDGISGQPLQLKIAAENVPNFVDVGEGGWGSAIQDPLNSSQTPTMANFATLADVLAGCVAEVSLDACEALFEASVGPDGKKPADTLAAAHAIAEYPWYGPHRIFKLLATLYPIPEGRPMRAVPYMPYLNYEPSAWVLPLKFDGGGYRAGGKAMFDSEGNLWVGNNFTVGWQGQDSLWQGSASKFASSGKPLSPITTGFTGGGMMGGTFGAAVDAKDNAWLTSYGSKSITVFDKTGKPLTPPDGITFGGRLGLMQGIIVAPNGDVWALGIEKRQLIKFPGGDWTKGEILCEDDSAEPCKSFTAPFHLAIDQQDRIWVSDSSLHVIRFPASDPSKAVRFDVRSNNSGLNIDSGGNVWVTNRFGSGLLGMAHMIDMAMHLKAKGVASASDYLTTIMSEQTGGSGSITLLRPDGSQYPGSPFTAGGLPGPWAVVVDGNDNVWVSNFNSPSSPITELCGTRTENCPPGFKTGDQIAPKGGYVGGGLQMQTDIAIDPAGNVWAMNNWQDINSCIGTPEEALSTRCGGQGVVVFYGMAKPVRSPQIGPAVPFE